MATSRYLFVWPNGIFRNACQTSPRNSVPPGFRRTENLVRLPPKYWLSSAIHCCTTDVTQAASVSTLSTNVTDTMPCSVPVTSSAPMSVKRYPLSSCSIIRPPERPIGYIDIRDTASTLYGQLLDTPGRNAGVHAIGSAVLVDNGSRAYDTPISDRHARQND